MQAKRSINPGTVQHPSFLQQPSHDAGYFQRWVRHNDAAKELRQIGNQISCAWLLRNALGVVFFVIQTIGQLCQLRYCIRSVWCRH